MSAIKKPTSYQKIYTTGRRENKRRLSIKRLRFLSSASTRQKPPFWLWCSSITAKLQQQTCSRNADRESDTSVLGIRIYLLYTSHLHCFVMNPAKFGNRQVLRPLMSFIRENVTVRNRLSLHSGKEHESTQNSEDKIRDHFGFSKVDSEKKQQKGKYFTVVHLSSF